MALLTLLTALCIAGVAAWYSIVGLMAIFAGAVIPIAIMGAVLEVGKLVTAAWLHLNWKKVPFLMKTYLTIAVAILMLITSLGIFGFLSKAHLEHSISTGGTNELQITNLERQIERQQAIIADAETVLAQLDDQVATLIRYDRIRGPSGSIATRQGQAEERQTLNENINAAYNRIEEIQTQLTPLQQEKLAIEVEVGPLKYIAELIYGDGAENYFDEAVRWVILLLVTVFDPLAVVLLLAATLNFKQKRHSEIFYDDGNMRVNPNNVVDVDGDLDIPIVDVPLDEYRIVEDEIPEDDDIEDYEVFEEPDEKDLDDYAEYEEESKPKRKRRLVKFLYGEDVRGVPKIGRREEDL